MGVVNCLEEVWNLRYILPGFVTNRTKPMRKWTKNLTCHIEIKIDAARCILGVAVLAKLLL